MKRSDHFRIPFLHIFGIVIIITGVFLLWNAFNDPAHKKPELPEDISSSEEEDDDIETYYSAVRERAGSAKRIGTAIIGGMLILGAVPVFYVPYTSSIFKFRRSKKEDADKRKSEESESENETEDEFGFPDDIVIKRNEELINRILESFDNESK